MDAAKRLLDNRQSVQDGALARRLVDDAEVTYTQSTCDLRHRAAAPACAESVGGKELVNTRGSGPGGEGPVRSRAGAASYAESTARITGRRHRPAAVVRRCSAAGTPGSPYGHSECRRARDTAQDQAINVRCRQRVDDHARRAASSVTARSPSSARRRLPRHNCAGVVAVRQPR